jgi:hypothetical protein
MSCGRVEGVLDAVCFHAEIACGYGSGQCWWRVVGNRSIDRGKRLQVKIAQIVMMMVHVEGFIWVGETSHLHRHDVDRQRAYHRCQEAWGSELRPCVISLLSLYLKAAAL